MPAAFVHFDQQSRGGFARSNEDEGTASRHQAIGLTRHYGATGGGDLGDETDVTATKVIGPERRSPW